MTLVLSSGPACLTLDPGRGARWRSLRVDGLELLADVALDGAWSPALGGCFVMAPYAGRVRDAALQWGGRHVRLPATAPPHAMHGTVLDVPWQVESASQDRAVLTVAMPGPWPLLGQVRQHLRLAPASLEVVLELRAEVGLPATLGLHPWFRRRLARGGEVELDLPAHSQYLRGRDGLPTGQLVVPRPGPWDDCFLLGAPPVLRWPGALELTVRSSHDHWVVYDELPEALCLEPQTGPPNAVELGAATLVGAGCSTSLHLELTWRPLSGGGWRPVGR